MEPSPHRHIAPDHLIADRYRLEQRLATGGTAEVWDARDERLARRVAVKTLHPHLARDESVRERFRREAVAAARLHHPGIVRVFDTCSDGEVEALVMEFVEGGTLRDLLGDEPTDPVLAAAVCAEVADALEHAHRNGLVHRDVKPSNILLSDDGRVLVADLGIAKLDDGADLTRTDVTLLGTARYLAPEQVEGGDVDARADVYALGVVLYEAVCGRPPFEADSEVALALQRLHRDPLSPRQVRADVARDLEAVIMRALERDPDDRFGSAAEMRAALLDLPDVSTFDLPRALTRTRPVRRTTPPTGTSDVGGPATDATRAERDPTRAGGAPQPTPPAFVDTERRWLLPAGLIVLVAVALAVAAVLFGTTSVGRDLFTGIRDATGGARAVPLTLSGAQPFDPGGDGQEHDHEAAAAIDGDPATAWTTEGYNARQIGTKPGVGIVLTLAEPAEVSKLALTADTEGWAAQIYVARAPASDLAGWGQPVGQVKDGGTKVTVDLGGRSAAAVLIWITDLGGGGPPFRFELQEAQVTG